MDHDADLESFLFERYCWYTGDGDGRRLRLEIHHPPWRLQEASATIAVNTMAEASGLRLPGMAPLLHCAKRQDVVAWEPVEVQSSKFKVQS